MSFASTSSSRILLPCCRAARQLPQQRSLATNSTSRASSSTLTGSDSTYHRPLKSGELPVYDRALAYIQEDREKKLASLKYLRQQLEQTSSEDRKAVLQERILGLEVTSEINDPEVRWKYKNGLADMSKPVFRYLAEEEWRRDGTLGILMQRITQMHIVPDLMSHIDPDVNLRVMLQEGSIDPGVFLRPDQTIVPPIVEAQVYHPEERLYMLLMLDPDSPDPSKDTFKTFVHWAMCNIPLSSTISEISASTGSVLQSYIPPHPQEGTPYHRYTFILYEQPGPLNPSESHASVSDDNGFNARNFAAQHQIEPVGIHFFRQIWDKSVSTVYNDVLRQPEPRFGRPKRKVSY